MKIKFVTGMILVMLLNLGASVIVAQNNGESFLKISSKPNKTELSGNLQFDSKLTFQEIIPAVQDENKNLNAGKKSVWLAVGLSAVVPGAGEIYTGNYWKTAVFLAIEAAAITTGLIYDKKGDDQTNSFQSFADQHWSAERYAKWTIYHAQSINSGVDPSQYKVFGDDGKLSWSELNRLESAISGYYSHHLPGYGEQQYYELIGKYPQFNVGWDDFGDDVTKAYSYGDPLTPRFHYYSGERGKANDYYNVASKAVLVIMINHFISALDAAWSAHSYNKNLAVNVSLEKYREGYHVVYYPQLNLKYNF